MTNILFFFSSTKVGGAETNILKISRELARESQYQIYWCTLDDDGPLLDLVDFPLKEYRLFQKFYKKPFAFRKSYRQFIQKNKIDIVFNFGLRVELASRIFSKGAGVKSIISNIRSTDDWRKWYHVFLDKITQGSVDFWVSNSEAGKKAFVKREKIPESKIEVIHNFFEPVVHETLPSTQIPNAEKNIRIGVLANVSVNKGYWLLIDLVRNLKAQGYRPMVIYAGYDRSNGTFDEALAQSEVQSNFKYLGYISDKTLFFEQIDLFVLPSYWEGLPTSILEAMAYRKPVVATRVGGVGELIKDRESGVLVNAGDVEGIARAVLTVYENPLQYIDAASGQLKYFTKETIMEKWKRLIESFS